jgi:hypothetical protein
MLKDKIVKIRWVKNYASANNHVAIGHVVDETDHYLIADCRTFHFGKLIRDRSRIKAGKPCHRAIPWNRIEVIHVLADDTDWKVDFKVDVNGNLILDNKHKTLIAKTKGRHLPEGETCRNPI